MQAIKHAEAFFHACESLAGYEGCRPYAADGAGFDAQCEPLVEMTTVEEYTNWFRDVGSGPLKGLRYKLHAAGFDPDARQALFFGTIEATHQGDGGPVPPTNRSTQSHYVYVLTMDDDDKVKHMTKIWNAPWALRDLGWL